MDSTQLCNVFVLFVLCSSDWRFDTTCVTSRTQHKAHSICEVLLGEQVRGDGICPVKLCGTCCLHLHTSCGVAGSPMLSCGCFLTLANWSGLTRRAFFLSTCVVPHMVRRCCALKIHGGVLLRAFVWCGWLCVPLGWCSTHLRRHT